MSKKPIALKTMISETWYVNRAAKSMTSGSFMRLLLVINVCYRWSHGLLAGGYPCRISARKKGASGRRNTAMLITKETKKRYGLAMLKTGGSIAPLGFSIKVSRNAVTVAFHTLP